MDSITISKKELEDVLCEVGSNLAEETATKDDLFLSLLCRLYF